MPGSVRFMSFKKWALPGVIILLLIGAGALLLSGGRPPAVTHYLAIYEKPDGKLLFRCPVEPGDLVTLDYRHSADGTPVSSSFIVADDGLRLISEDYSWYGSGLESGSGYSFSFSEDNVSVSGYDRLFSELPIRVARTVPQIITMPGQSVLLSELAPGGALLVIKINRD